jgi:hypothetical protein
MGAIKNNLDLFPDTQAFDQGESFGRHAERHDLLPLLKAVYFVLRGYAPRADVTGKMLDLVEAIECPPAPPVTTTPTDDESVNF